jgi:hypothetical protein
MVDGRPDLGCCWIWTGATSTRGYGMFWLNGKQVAAHRYSYECVNGKISRFKIIDHMCHRESCVNPSHLRAASIAENAQNRNLSHLNKSGYKGVWWDKTPRKWRVMIGENGNRHYVGHYKTIKEAYEAYCNAVSELHLEFANYGHGSMVLPDDLICIGNSTVLAYSFV